MKSAIEPKVGQDHTQDDPSCAHRLCGLADGELVADEAQIALQQLLGDQQARLWWDEIHWVGDALRSSETAAQHHADFHRRILDRIEREHTVLQRQGFGQRAWQWLMHHLFVPGVALGAAAVVLAVMVMPQWRLGAIGPSVDRTLEAQAPAREPVQAGAVVVVKDNSMHPYLQAHRELVPTHGVLPASAPYLRTSAVVQPKREP